MVAPLDLIQSVSQLGQWAQAHPWTVMGGFVAVPIAVGTLGLLLGRGRHTRPETFGSARWSTSREIRRAGLLRTRGVVLGRLDRAYLCDDSDRHVLLVGPTRSGKGIGVIIPTLLVWRESALVLDAKNGENYDISAAWRRLLGPVYAFTPMQGPQTRINVLDTVRLKTPQASPLEPYKIKNSTTY